MKLKNNAFAQKNMAGLGDLAAFTAGACAVSLLALHRYCRRHASAKSLADAAGRNNGAAADFERVQRGKYAEWATTQGISRALVAAIPSSSGIRRPKAAATFRLMQWNLLADGLSRDGFSVRPVLSAWPVPLGQYARAGGGGDDIEAVLRKVMDAGREADKSAREAALKGLQTTYGTPLSARNLDAVVDFEGRLLRMLSLIQEAGPDVLTVQELDRMGILRDALAELGYVCGTPDAMARTPYTPLFYGRHEGSNQTYLEALRATGLAFAPKMQASSCRLSAFRSIPRALLAQKAAEMMGEPEKRPTMDGQAWKDLFKDPAFHAAGGLARLLGLCGVEAADLQNFDDDGPAIFWKADR